VNAGGGRADEISDANSRVALVQDSGGVRPNTVSVKCLGVLIEQGSNGGWSPPEFAVPQLSSLNPEV
jgi:hypothetical protein